MAIGNRNYPSRPSIGQLRHVGYFEGNNAKVAYTAGYVDGYNTILTSVRCKLYPIHKSRTDEFGQVQLTSTWIMICRFQSAIDAHVKINSKFVSEGKRYTITGIEIIDEVKFFYQFNLNEITT